MEREKSSLKHIMGFSIREVLERANSLGIVKRDIVSIFQKDDQICLVYYSV